MALAAGAAALPGGPAGAGPGATSPAAAPQRTCTVAEPNVSFCGYFFTGSVQYFQAPPWLKEVTIAAVGAQGASGVGAGAAAGGLGGKVLATARLAPNAKVPILVGGTPVPGSGEGGWPDGGFSRGGGGGGSSSVLSGELNTRLVVAAGGGGGGTRGWAVPDPGIPGNGGSGGAPGPIVPGYGVPGAAGDGVQGQHASGSLFTAGGGYGATAFRWRRGRRGVVGCGLRGLRARLVPRRRDRRRGRREPGRQGRLSPVLRRTVRRRRRLRRRRAAAASGPGAEEERRQRGRRGRRRQQLRTLRRGRVRPQQPDRGIRHGGRGGPFPAGLEEHRSHPRHVDGLRSPVSAVARRLPSGGQTADLFGIDDRGAAFHQTWTPGPP